MQGAGKYAVPIFSTYEQLGLEKLYDKSTPGYIYYGNHTVFDFDEHARGKTLDIYLVEDEEEFKEKGLFECKRIHVYGAISGQMGWTEKYGWIIEGAWCEYINDILEGSIELFERCKRIVEEDKRQRKIEEQEKLKKRAKEFEKFFQ